MLNEKVFLTTLKNNFDNTLDRVDDKIEKSLPCYKKIVDCITIPLADIETAISENDGCLTIDTINLTVGDDYILEFSGYTLQTTCVEDNGPLLIFDISAVLVIMVGDKWTYDPVNQFSKDNTKTTIDLSYTNISPSTDLVIKKVIKKTLDNDLLNDDLVIRNSISIGRRKGSEIGYYSVAEGDNTTASGYASHAEGYNTTASGESSHAEGASTEASGGSSHAEGYSTTASGQNSHAEGAETFASGYASHAEGYKTSAEGMYSHTEGMMTDATGAYQHVQGRANIIDNENKYAHIVGNGEVDQWSVLSRSNAHTLDWEGNAWYAGNVFVGGANKDEGKELSTKEYVDESILSTKEYVDESILSTKEYVDEVKEDIAKLNSVKDGIFLKDQVTGDNYLLQMRNGILVTSIAPSSISLSSSPTKVEYYDGDRFEIDGIILEANNNDGTSSTIDDVENLSFEPEYMTEDTTSVTIKYNYFGYEYTVDVPVTVSAFDPAIVLVDFEYTDNGDGTYTITGWKGTLNGETSTEIVMPNNKNVIL